MKVHDDYNFPLSLSRTGDSNISRDDLNISKFQSLSRPKKVLFARNCRRRNIRQESIRLQLISSAENFNRLLRWKLFVKLQFRSGESLSVDYNLLSNEFENFQPPTTFHDETWKLQPPTTFSLTQTLSVVEHFLTKLFLRRNLEFLRIEWSWRKLGVGILRNISGWRFPRIRSWINLSVDIFNLSRSEVSNFHKFSWVYYRIFVVNFLELFSWSGSFF